SNIGAGTYILNVVDTKCGNVDITYTVPENDEIISAPSVSNLQLCSSGNALISVNNPSATAVYRLYDNATSAQPLYEQTGGRFNINISGNRSYYVSQLNGTCESPRAQIDITVGLSALNIPNAFTPNGDGINDYWKINGMENYPTCTIQVFTRYGQKVFESKGYVHPFDGTMNGKPLAVGVYYYLINLSSNCSILSGNLTIIR
ncbi:MAG: T9SS type B sorting domain-containing protein, partial [Mucilaginibacter sp.]